MDAGIGRGISLPLARWSQSVAVLLKTARPFALPACVIAGGAAGLAIAISTGASLTGVLFAALAGELVGGAAFFVLPAVLSSVIEFLLAAGMVAAFLMAINVLGRVL